MTRLNLVLLLVLVASALSLVHQQYEARRLFVALERANAAADRLASDHEQLQVQKRTLAAPARVQQLASERLQMRPIHPGITEVLVLPIGSSSGPAGTGAAGPVQRLQGPVAAPAASRPPLVSPEPRP
ncbi:cell division protein [Serpentinimonas raichei]|uniref:Cell division protein FtsL n=1 Tax=Serpentinimonas raichei TaxID=1458425 RepID=A0A060NQT5_9BURK|nr:cell division protein FtsL [Serpentinimonas raichei]BAO81863.1 cell division protein [Serpentinimonas raichei]